MAMLASSISAWSRIEDKMTVMIIGDSPVLAQSLESGGIEATYLNYTHSRSLKEKGLSGSSRPGQSADSLPRTGGGDPALLPPAKSVAIDALMRGFVETIAFIHKPSNKEVVVKALMKNLRLRNLDDAETGYQSLQWLYKPDIKPTIPGIQNMARLLALGNPKVKTVKMEDVVDDAPWHRLEKSPFYRDLVSQIKK